MKIEARIDKLESQTQTTELKIIFGTDAEIKEFQSMDDEMFFKETGIDRAAYNLIIYAIDKFGK